MSNPICIPGVAHEAISKGQFVKQVAGGFDACDSAGEHADGVAWNDALAGEALTVQVGGIIKYKVGSNPISDGAEITVTAAGLGDAATQGDYVRCKAKGAGAAGAFAEAYWFDGYVFDGT
jgi:predicted transcriptional regulator